MISSPPESRTWMFAFGAHPFSTAATVAAQALSRRQEPTAAPLPYPHFYGILINYLTNLVLTRWEIFHDSQKRADSARFKPATSSQNTTACGSHRNTCYMADIIFYVQRITTICSPGLIGILEGSSPLFPYPL